eukprot:114825-Amphidinium_carterae.1
MQQVCFTLAERSMYKILWALVSQSLLPPSELSLGSSCPGSISDRSRDEALQTVGSHSNEKKE